MEPCLFCEKEIKYASLGGRDASKVLCPQCGEFEVSRTALVTIRNADLTERQKANISGWLVENNNFEINTYNFDEFLFNLSSPSFVKKADKLLEHIASQSVCAGTSIFYNPNFMSHSYSMNAYELEAVIEYLQETKRIIAEGGEYFFQHEYKITPNGWIRLDECSKDNVKSSQGFVAMWFDGSMTALYDDAIAPAILDAGYEAHRVDLREHNDKIDDEIISQIRKSKFVVADFTGHRGGVYFEAGFAKGLGLDVFWLCREDDLANLHFDIRQYNCIVWNDSNKKELRKRLTARIESVLGNGKIPNKAN
jgi:predicted RNA-binding Zn-ribbon protein involved in translation (DUF1610 family)